MKILLFSLNSFRRVKCETFISVDIDELKNRTRSPVINDCYAEIPCVLDLIHAPFEDNFTVVLND